MINVFKKLEIEGLLAPAGNLLDLGSGPGKLSEPFIEHGYTATLVDKNPGVLAKARERLTARNFQAFTIKEQGMESFDFTEGYDGILISNALPFIQSKAKVTEILHQAYGALRPGGFLFFTLFGPKDQWAGEKQESMSFFDKEEAGNILESEPYYLSEDYGTGATMAGPLKRWHILHFLYIK
jgi:SAM-dependent methyltransferase